MRMYILLKGCFFGSILFLLMSCGELKKELDVTINPKDCEWYVMPNSKLNSEKNRLDMYVLRLYASGSYVFCADLLFETGTWNYDDEKGLMILKSKDIEGKEQLRYMISEKQKKNEVVFQFYQQYPVGDVDEVVEVRAIANKSSSDPYGLTAHEWRNKPTVEESAEQIKTRTLSYLRFLEVLYAHAIENNLENPGGKWYPRPVKFYSNKVTMAYADELIDWYNCFYNEAQGIEAYKLLSGALMKVKITGDDDNSRNLNCVKQLKTLIQKT
jgi:hypothetical protein